MNNLNEWQQDEIEILEPPSSVPNKANTCPKSTHRPIDQKFISIVGTLQELDNVIEYLKAPFYSNQLELPPFIETTALGTTVLVLDLESHIMYKSEIGLLLHNWATFYLPLQSAALVKELTEEAKRYQIKQQAFKQFD